MFLSTIAMTNDNATTTRSTGDVTMSAAAAADQNVIVACSNSYNETVTNSVGDSSDNISFYYAQSLRSSLADVCAVNESRVANIRVSKNLDNGTLLIEFSIQDGASFKVSAVEAVANLKRLLLPLNAAARSRRDNERRISRRDVSGGGGAAQGMLQLTSSINNRTLTPTAVYNWTDSGLCPDANCGNSALCRCRPNGQLYCECPAGYRGDIYCSSVSGDEQQPSCTSRLACIVPAVVAPVGGFLLVVVIIVIVVVVVVRRRRRRAKLSPMMYGGVSAVNPVFDMQTVEVRTLEKSKRKSKKHPHVSNGTATSTISSSSISNEDVSTDDVVDNNSVGHILSTEQMFY
jgi:hypothetical protein